MKHPTLMGWVGRQRRESLPKARRRSRMPVFMEAEVAVPAAGGQAALRVELGTAAVLKIADVGQVPLAAQLIKALQKPC